MNERFYIPSEYLDRNMISSNKQRSRESALFFLLPGPRSWPPSPPRQRAVVSFLVCHPMTACESSQDGVRRIVCVLAAFPALLTGAVPAELLKLEALAVQGRGLAVARGARVRERRGHRRAGARCVLLRIGAHTAHRGAVAGIAAPVLAAAPGCARPHVYRALAAPTRMPPFSARRGLSEKRTKLCCYFGRRTRAIAFSSTITTNYHIPSRMLNRSQTHSPA